MIRLRRDLYGELKQFAKKDAVRFHMPGHNGGNGISARLKRDFFQLDVTEFEETDDLQAPTGILKDAQERAAAACGAAKTFFLTCGSTVGLEAMILGCCKKGDILLVDRNCHRAVISALILGEITPVFLSPEWDVKCRVWRGFTREQMERALAQNPNCVGALITSPTYYGVCSELDGIADALHRRGKLLLVDEAHGAHFGFHKELPRTALEQGADFCVQSLHKTLPAMGQSAVLHVGRGALDKAEDVERCLRLLHTTSPSYAMMAGMDEAIAQMRGSGQRSLKKLLQKCSEMKAELRAVGRLYFADEASLGCPQDPLRLVIGFDRLGISGRTAARVLREQHGIYAEMADACHVVFLVNVGNTERELCLLWDALKRLEEEQPEDAQPERFDLSLPPIECVLPPAVAFRAERETIPISEAEGRICAEVLAVCPPGAAAVIPGQRLTKEVLRYLKLQIGRTDIAVFAKDGNG